MKARAAALLVAERDNIRSFVAFCFGEFIATLIFLPENVMAHLKKDLTEFRFRPVVSKAFSFRMGKNLGKVINALI